MNETRTLCAAGAVVFAITVFASIFAVGSVVASDGGPQSGTSDATVSTPGTTAQSIFERDTGTLLGQVNETDAPDDSEQTEEGQQTTTEQAQTEAATESEATETPTESEQTEESTESEETEEPTENEETEEPTQTEVPTEGEETETPTQTDDGETEEPTETVEPTEGEGTESGTQEETEADDDNGSADTDDSDDNSEDDSDDSQSDGGIYDDITEPDANENGTSTDGANATAQNGTAGGGAPAGNTTDEENGTAGFGTETGTDAASTPAGQGNADLRIRDASLSADWVRSGFNTTVRTTVQNSRSRPVNETLTVTVDGEPVATNEVALDPEEEMVVETEFEAVNGTVRVNGETAGQLTVENQSVPATDGDEQATTAAQGPGFSLAQVGVGVAVLAVVGWTRRGLRRQPDR